MRLQPSVSPRAILSLGVLVCFFELLVVNAGYARGPAPALSFVRGAGAESCITSVALAKKVESILGGPVFVSASEAELVIEGYVNPKQGGGFDARLMVTDDSGRWLGIRDLSTDRIDCSSLDEALALVIAVTINPESGLAGESILPPETSATLERLFPHDAAEVAVAEQAAAIPEPSANRPSEQNRSTPTSLPRGPKKSERVEVAPHPDYPRKAVKTTFTMYLGAATSLGIGLQPSIAPGFSLEGGYQSNKVFRLGLRGAFSLPTREQSAADSSRRASFQAFSLTPFACPLSLVRPPHTISGCAGVMVGAVRVVPRGFSFKNEKDSVLVVNPIFELRVKRKLDDRISPRIGFAVILPLIQHAFAYNNQAGETLEMFRMHQIALAAELGLEAKF